MEFTDVVRRRRMVRSYAPRPVDPAAVDLLLEHAIRAPSAGFSQGWAFLVLDEPRDVGRFWDATTPSGAKQDSRWLSGMRSAPVVIVPLSSKDAYLDRYAEPDKGWTDRDEARWLAPYWDIDTGMASLLMLLSAVDQDLAACFFGIPVEQVSTFCAEFSVPATHRPIGAITLGHPATDHTPSSRSRGRRPLTEVVHRGDW